jgi:hypothetical protein
MNFNSLRFTLISTLLGGVLLTPAFATQAQDWTDFKTCITSASGPQWNGTTSTCTLPYYASPYTTASVVTVTSSSVRTVSTGSGGTVSTSPQATIQRDVSGVTGSTTPFAILSASSATHDLIFEYLTIDGNRQNSNILECGSAVWVDLDLTNAGYNSSPSAYHGASVQYMNFVNAPAFSITLGQWGYVYSSTIQYARYGGIYE